MEGHDWTVRFPKWRWPSEVERRRYNSRWERRVQEARPQEVMEKEWGCPKLSWNARRRSRGMHDPSKLFHKKSSGLKPRWLPTHKTFGIVLVSSEQYALYAVGKRYNRIAAVIEMTVSTIAKLPSDRS